MKVIPYILLTLSLSTTASECNISPEVISASYDVTSQVVSKVTPKENNQRSTAATKTQQLELHRNHNRILKKNNNQKVHEIWSVNGNRYSLSRAFEQYQHAIEYQSNELKYQPKKKDIFQIVTTPELNQMQLVKQASTGCNLAQHYTLKGHKNSYDLVWLPELRLVKSFSVTSPSTRKTWELTDYQSDSAKVAEAITHYDNYQTTDYADIGDNESIPFLAAMINQGFTSSSKTKPAHHEHEGHDH